MVRQRRNAPMARHTKSIIVITLMTVICLPLGLLVNEIFLKVFVGIMMLALFEFWVAMRAAQYRRMCRNDPDNPDNLENVEGRSAFARRRGFPDKRS